MALDVFGLCYEFCISFLMSICIQVSLSLLEKRKEGLI